MTEYDLIDAWMRFAKAFWAAHNHTPKAIRISKQHAERLTRECKKEVARRPRA